ncbi:MAG TPA: hypothetical protein VGK73_02140, partial [Polyangiaceae bacterium]
PNDAADQQAAIQVVPEVLNRFTIGDEAIEFSRVEDEDGTPGYVIVQQAPSNLTSGLFDRVLNVEEDLTLLEKFYAIAPEHEAPNPALVELHTQQVRALGRADAGIRRIALGPAPLVDKDAVSTCVANVFPSSEAPWSNVLSRGPGNILSVCTLAATACNQYTTMAMVGGSCTQGTAGTASPGYSYKSQGGSWRTVVLSTNMRVNQKIRVYWESSLPTVSKPRVLQMSNSVLTGVGNMTVTVHSATRVGPIVP